MALDLAFTVHYAGGERGGGVGGGGWVVFDLPYLYIFLFAFSIRFVVYELLKSFNNGKLVWLLSYVLSLWPVIHLGGVVFFMTIVFRREC